MRGSGKALRAFGLIFCFLPVWGNLLFPASASSTAEEPAAGWYADSISEFSLTDAAQLSGFAELVNKGVSFSGKTVRLANDIDLAQLPWTAIGTKDAPFQGTFDGNGHTVSGLFLKNTEDDQGFFGCIDGKARVENFTLEGSVSGGLHTGGAVGWAKSGFLDHIVSRLTVTAANTSDQSCFAGGIAGLLAGSPDQLGSVIVSCCRNEGSVSGHAAGGIAGEATNGSVALESCVNGVPGGEEDCGKITGSLVAGLLAQAYQFSRGMVISNGVNYAPITSEGGVGGIACMFSGTVNSCENIGNLTGSDVAGIVENIGSGSCVVRNCTNSGMLTCSSASVSSVGGIAAVSSADSLTVESCLNDGAIRANRRAWTGGILADGRFSKAVTIRTCRNTGNMTGGFVIAGGIAGIGVGEINGCANLGGITCTSPGSVINGDFSGIGGIVGVEYNDSVLKCSYNRGEIRGAADGSECCRYGGIAGYLYPGVQYTLKSNYSAAPVLAPRGSAGGFAGELASVSSASAGNYYDGSLCSAKGIGGKDPGGTWLSNETSAGMTEDNFAKKLDGSQFSPDTRHQNRGYPVLSWEIQSTEKGSSGKKAESAKKADSTTEAAVSVGSGPAASAAPQPETGLTDGKNADSGLEQTSEPSSKAGSGEAKPAAPKTPKVLRGYEITPAEIPAPDGWGMAKVLAFLFATLLMGAASVRFLIFRKSTK